MRSDRTQLPNRTRATRLALAALAVVLLDDCSSAGGSTSTLADCVRWAVDVAGLPEADVLTAATTTPASVLSA